MRPPFSVFEPDPSRETPVVVEVPHAGLDVPAVFAPLLLARARCIAKDADLYVDELYADAPSRGATLLVAHVSRYVVDLNRGEADVDGDAVAGVRGPLRAPRGLIWRLSTEGEACIPRALTRAEVDARLDAVYRPYHAELTRIVERKLRRFGFAVILAAHSMPGTSRPVPGEPATRRADVVPGTQGRTTAHERFIDAVDRHARDAGLSVLHDDPYRGGFTTRHYGKPRSSVHAVQVELARRLYMDESSLVPTPKAFASLRAFCTGLVGRLGEVRPPGG